MAGDLRNRVPVDLIISSQGWSEADRDLVAAYVKSNESRYRLLFEEASIPIWEDDFSRIKLHFDTLRSKGVTDFRSYFEANPEDVITCTRLLRISDINNACRKLFGVSGSREMNEKIHDFFTDASRAVFREELIALAHGTMKYEGPVPVRMLNGELRTFYLNLSVVPGYEDSLAKVIVAFTDITRQKRHEKVLEARLRLMEYSRNRPLDGLLTLMLDDAEELAESRVGFFHFVDRDQVSLTLQAWSTRTRSEYCRADITSRHLPLDRAGAWAECIIDRKPLIHNAYGSLPNRRELPAGHTVIERELVVPIISNDIIVAVLGVGNKPYDYTASDAETILEYAHFAWDAIELKLGNDALLQARSELEQKVVERTAELVAINEKLKESTFDLVWAEERERERIAVELHDRVGQSLLLAKIKLDSLIENGGTPDEIHQASDASALIHSSIQDIRSLTFRMRPPILDTAGIETALKWLCSSIGKEYGLFIEFISTGHDFRLSDVAHYSIYQIVRELLLNVTKHANAGNAQVSIASDAHTIVIRVVDDGIGIEDPDAVLKHVNDGGYGLYSVRQRIDRLGGTFAITSTAGCGTAATLTVPHSDR